MIWCTFAALTPSTSERREPFEDDQLDHPPVLGADPRQHPLDGVGDHDHALLGRLDHDVVERTVAGRGRRWKSAIRRAVIVRSHTWNSPSEDPSNADWIALTSTSDVTSSTAAGGTFSATRRATLCQCP